MTFADLFTTLVTRGLPRAKDCKTALRLLATALGYPSMEACPVDTACREEATWGKALDDHFQQLQMQGRIISGGNRRNIRSNLRTVFKEAEAHGLLTAPLPPVLLATPPRRAFERQQRETSPYRSTYARYPGRGYGLPQAEWPPDIVEGWRRYRAKCGLRETTLGSYVNCMESYVGYLAHVAQVQPQWADVFDTVQLTEFLRWHGARHKRPLTVHGRHVVMMIAAMAVVLKHPHARELADLRNTLKPPAPVHNKRVHHWVSLAQLEAVAQACLREGRLPGDTDRRSQTPGLRRVLAFQRGVMLALLVRVPLRQRNVREMQEGKHLYKDHEGHWQLHFQGDDLKIGTRGSQANKYEMDLTKVCPEFIPVLEEWLTVYRPRLPNPTGSTLLFLTRYGTPYTVNSLRIELASSIAMRTGQRFYPHMIRTIWATEYLKATQDYATAATMLGDTLAVVIETYYSIVQEEQHTKAAAFLTTALKG